jgi:limonene-1,2-epoxide hydrolase
MRGAVERIEAFFTALTPADVARIGEFYTADVTFKDPFNEVRGLPEVQRIFTHMYEALDNPRFVITGRVVDGAQCFLVWEFRFAFRNFHKGVEQVVRGGSHLQLAPDGRIASHRDYWDAAEELYEKLPLVGGLMRWLKRRANG